MTEQEDQQRPDVSSQEMHSPGDILHRAREAKNISLVDVANELRLSVTCVANLEKNDFSEMGAITFAKGYLRSYAKFLGAPEEDVLQAFDAMNLGADILTRKPILIDEKMGGARRPKQMVPRRLGYVVLLLVVAIIAAFWWHNHERISHSVSEMTASVMQQAHVTTAATGLAVPSPSPSVPVSQTPGMDTYALPVQQIGSPQGPAANANVQPTAPTVSAPISPPVAPVEPPPADMPE